MFIITRSTAIVMTAERTWYAERERENKRKKFVYEIKKGGGMRGTDRLKPELVVFFINLSCEYEYRENAKTCYNCSTWNLQQDVLNITHAHMFIIKSFYWTSWFLTKFCHFFAVNNKYLLDWQLEMVDFALFKTHSPTKHSKSYNCQN